MVISWEQLRDAREYASYTQAELAKELGVSVRTIVNWESDGGNGVPRKMERKVRDLLEPAMETLEQHVYPLRDMPPPQPLSDDASAAEVQRQHEEHEANEASLARLGIRDVRSIEKRRRREAMKDFTDVDLLEELHDRALRVGSAASDWSTRAVDLRDRRRRSVGGRTDDYLVNDELQHAADTENETPDEDLRTP